jgi:hypothetical protein
MKREEIQAWYEQLIAVTRTLPGENSRYGKIFQEQTARGWATMAESALQAVFPDGHATRQAWDRVVKHPQAKDISAVMEKLIGVFEGAAFLVRDNRLGSLIDSIRLESESELLDQASVLVDNDYRAAAAVIAGGALETHLHHYVDKHGIPIAGDGTISKYNSSVGQARKANPILYSANDGKLVEAWGGYRNEAAHKPGDFNRSKDDVKRMIEGIREFIGRTG